MCFTRVLADLNVPKTILAHRLQSSALSCICFQKKIQTYCFCFAWSVAKKNNTHTKLHRQHSPHSYCTSGVNQKKTNTIVQQTYFHPSGQSQFAFRFCQDHSAHLIPLSPQPMLGHGPQPTCLEVFTAPTRQELNTLVLSFLFDQRSESRTLPRDILVFSVCSRIIRLYSIRFREIRSPPVEDDGLSDGSSELDG